PRRRPWRSLTRAFSWHRRKLAVVAAVAAVLLGISATNPEGPPTLRVVRATSQLMGGATLASADLELADVVEDEAPDGALLDPADVVGKVVAAPIARGQVLTELAVVGPAGVSPGKVVAPLRLADADLAALLKPGERVDVLVADQQTTKAAVVASAVRVVAVPAMANPDQQTQAGALVLVEVDPGQAAALAQASVSGSITVIWR
ncbi:MAG TPA: RcpC/CpaB family pilus assembly protein, partial [Propionibacteriaceae bacterium]